MHQILVAAGIRSWLRPYGIIALTPDSGLIEAIPDTVSLDVLRRRDYSSLLDFFVRFFGPENSAEFKKAQDNFVRSLAAYSILCYILNLKDRHNGNILLDRKGHIIHIDYGFMLGKG
jgi:phosphatidylinositol 4-kinase